MNLQKLLIAIGLIILSAGLVFVVIPPSLDKAPISTGNSDEKGFPFAVGEIEYDDFTQKVIPANKKIKTLRVQSISSVTTSEGEDVALTNGYIDQRDIENVKYRINVSHNDEQSEYIRVDDEIWVKFEVEDKWLPVGENDHQHTVTTSTDFFRGFGNDGEAITYLAYDGEDEVGHKFTMGVDLQILLDSPDESLGTSTTKIWINDELQMLRQETLVDTVSGTSILATEQKEFNEDFPEIISPDDPAFVKEK